MRETILARLAAQVAERGDAVALHAPRSGGAREGRALTWRELDAAARAVSAALVAGGFGAGERVAILAGNRVLWPVADLGVLGAGLVSVGVHPTSAPAQVREVLADSGARVAIVDTVAQFEVLAAAGLPEGVRLVVCEDLDDAPPALRDRLAAQARVASWADWLREGAAAPDGDAAAAADVRRARLAPGDLAILIYTSGSTGTPKGACLSHRTILASAESVRCTLGLRADDHSLSFLPFSHAAERIFGLYTRVHVGMRAVLVEEHARLWTVARETEPTLFGGLPRFFEKAVAALRAEEARADAATKARWERARRLGRERSVLRRAGQAVPAELEREWTEAAMPARECLAALFGGRLRLATSGGAAFPVAVAEYLDAFGLTVLGAYGLTEHLCVAFNRPGRYDFATAGPPMEGTELRIAADGEVLVRRNALTFSGYLGRPEATAEAFTADGEWLRTGDLGALDERGFLRVTGRAKELIALSTGKKVAPLPIEARLSADEWIAQAVLHGEGRKYVSALVSLRRDAVEAWAAESALALDYATLLRHPAVHARVQAAVDAVNAELSRAEQVRRFALLERELTVEDGELTPTLKVRRPVVEARYAEDLDALYAEETA